MNSPEIVWSLVEFDRLKPSNLYKILQLRQDVFIVEQNCSYNDIDGLDDHCLHLTGYYKDDLAGYLRIVPPGKNFSEPSLGRIIVDRRYRSKGVGSKLIRHGIKHTRNLYNNTPIRIEAQAYLQSFYESLDFETVSAPYDKDGIPHIQMLLNQK